MLKVPNYKKQMKLKQQLLAEKEKKNVFVSKEIKSKHVQFE